MYTSLRVAGTADDLDQVFRLRRDVFVEEEKRLEHEDPRLFDVYDTLPQSVIVMAEEGGRAVGTMRIVADNPIGLPALDHFDFRPLMETLTGGFVSMGWFCAAKEQRKHPGLVFGLLKLAVRESRRLGCRHVIAPLHPGIFPLLQRVGAVAVAPEFFDEELGVPVVPIHVDMDILPPGVRETMTDPLDVVLDESQERRIYRQGDEILKAGDVGDSAFAVMRGSVRVHGLRHHEGGERDVLLGPGQIFGELSLLDGGTRTNTITCHSREADVMVWSRNDFLSQISTDPAKATRICAILGSRLRVEDRGGAGTPAGDALVARILLGASNQGQQPVFGGWLASQAALWPEQLQETLRPWAEAGLLGLAEDGHITVLDPGGLGQFKTA